MIQTEVAAVLELLNLSKHFPTHKAVDRVSIQLARGEFFSLLGPSGCGKTTTLRMVAGFEDPTSGEIRLNGNSIQHLKPYQRNVSTVFQNYALFPHLTARQNIEFGLKRTRQSDIPRRTTEVLTLMQLGDKADRLPAKLSGGERQRVALARSLVLAPDVLLLDEPLSALDPNLRKQLRSELKSLQRRVGITFLFVTHDKDEALSLSDRVGVMRAGALEQVGEPEEIYLHPRTRFVASFLGPVNWIQQTGIRPETIRISAAPPGRPGTVLRSTFLGNCVQIEAKLDEGPLLLAETTRLNGAFAPGARAHFSWQPHDEIHCE